ncbi:MAG: hypothetical protein Roseis2KO_41530 [Roseivirga sp.]
MTLEGKIEQIMETWPLQIKVAASDHIHWIQVNEKTITKAVSGKETTTGTLRSDQRVRIEMDENTEGFNSASLIEIMP